MRAEPARMNSRPSGPASPPAPVATPSLGVIDLRGCSGSSSTVGFTVTKVVLVAVTVGEAVPFAWSAEDAIVLGRLDS